MPSFIKNQNPKLISISGMDQIFNVSQDHAVNLKIQVMDGMLENVIHSVVVFRIIAVKDMNWLENRIDSVKQLVIGRQKNYQHVFVSRIQQKILFKLLLFLILI